MLARVSKIIPYKYIMFLAMLLVTFDLAAVSVSYKMVTLNFLFEINSGATFIFPMTYALGDIITEVYGYSMARKLIWMSLSLQFVFALLVTAAIHLPGPLFWQDNSAYFIVFGSILRFVLAGTVANIVSSFMNVYIVSKLKIPFEGHLFWIRSILSALISGFIMVTIMIGIGFFGKEIDLSKSWILFKSSYSLELFYALILVIPASFAASFLKKSENIDVYDFNTNFNPFSFKETRTGENLTVKFKHV